MAHTTHPHKKTKTMENTKDDPVHVNGSQESVTDQPALARAEQSGRTLIGYQCEMTWKDESRDYGMWLWYTIMQKKELISGISYTNYLPFIYQAIYQQGSGKV